MKKLWLVFVLFLFWGCSKENSDIIVVGKAPRGVKVMKLLATDRNSSRLCQDTVDAEGNFRLECKREHPAFYVLESDNYKYRVRLFIHPGDNQKVDFKEENEIVFAQEGMEVNNFIRRLQQKQIELNSIYRPDYLYPDSAIQAFRKQADSLEVFVEHASLKDEDYVATQKCLLRLGMYNSMFNLPMGMRLFGGRDTILPASFYSFVQEMEFDQSALRNIDNINDYLKDYFSVLETNGYLKIGLTDFLQKRMERIGEPVVRENYLIYALQQEVVAFNQQLPEIFPAIESMVTTAENKQKLQEIKQQYQELAAKYAGLSSGNVGYDFTGKGLEDQVFSLENYKGKVVVVDVWSTNCIPCIGEMPYLLKLEQQFADKEVVFVSYSVDTQTKKWADFIEQKKLGGIQLVDTLGPKSDFVKHYLIHATPRMLLFDKAGNIADAFAPRPSDPRLALKIEALLD